MKWQWDGKIKHGGIENIQHSKSRIVKQAYGMVRGYERKQRRYEMKQESEAENKDMVW